MLYVNLLSEGGILLELQPQGDASVPVQLSSADAELLTSSETSVSLAKLFLAAGSTARACRAHACHQRAGLVEPTGRAGEGRLREGLQPDLASLR